MSVFAIMLTGMLLNWRMAAVSAAVYVLLGLIGVPVFSGFRGGLSVLVGPTGGFILSYVPMAAIISLISSLKIKNKIVGVFLHISGAIVGLVLCYLLGTTQFTMVTGSSFKNALAICVYPFIVFDLVKTAIAVIVAISVKRALPTYFQQLSAESSKA
jgi:biotin transport system substrate-specific component